MNRGDFYGALVLRRAGDQAGDVVGFATPLQAHVFDQAGTLADEEAGVYCVLLLVGSIESVAAQGHDFGPYGGDIAPGDDLFADGVARDAFALQRDALIEFSGPQH